MEKTNYENAQNESAQVFCNENNCIFIYLCAFCNKQFESSNLFVKHLSNEHSVELVANEKDTSQSKDYSKAGPGLESSECYFPDETINELVIDSRGSYEYETDENEADIQISLEKDSLLTNTDAKAKKRFYKCVHCQKQYWSKSSLENHRKAHENIEKIKCRHKTCSKTFTSSSGYFHHLRTHAKEKACLCEFCPKQFDQKCNLQVHIRRCHTLDKPYKCQYCEKAFASSTDRQIHERLHTGEKPFVCSLCSKEFITASKLTYHRKIHFQVKKYCCKKCDQKYSTRSLLYKHSLEHEKDLDCYVCGKRCRRLKTLSEHKKLHNEN